MNLFDWLFRKNRSAPAKPHRPKILSEFGPDSLQLVVEEVSGNGVMIMDRDNYDYLYGDLPNIAPAQHDLDSLFVGITRVRAIAGGIFRGKAVGNETILDVADATTLDELFRTLKIDEDPSTFCHCACLGGPTLEFLVGTRVVASIGLQHGHSIRWTQWKHDARLKDGDRLTRWLIDNGIDKDFLDVQFHNGYGAAGLRSLGFRRSKAGFLSPAEQRFRLVELERANGGDVKGIIDRCTDLFDREPGVGMGYAVRGLAYIDAGDFSNGVDDLTAAIDRGLHEAHLYFTRAVAYDHLGDTHAALIDCNSALAIAPDEAAIHNSRGLIHLRLGMCQEALRDLTEAIRLAPEWALPYLNRSAVYINMNELDSAIADCSHIIDAEGPKPSPESRHNAMMAFMNRSNCYRLSGNLIQAEKDASEANSRLSQSDRASTPAWQPMIMKPPSDVE